MNNLFSLREYQQDAVNQIEKSWGAGIKSICYQCPTGSGKTRILRTVVDNHYKSKKVIYIIAHRKNLVNQLSSELTNVGINHGLILSGAPYIDYRVQVCSIQTLTNRIDNLPEAEIIILDEFHHSVSNSYRKIINKWPNGKILGVTATPERMDGQALSDIAEKLITGPSMSYLIENKYLADYDYYAPDDVNMENTHIRKGEYMQSEMIEKVDKKTITGSAVAHYKKYSDHLPAIAACVNINHTEHVATEFKNAGYRAMAIHSKLDAAEIERGINGLGDGTVEILCNADLISEGVDIPGATTLIGLRPTNSLVVFLQHIGRILRISKNKEKAIILDHVGNWKRHGLPVAEREWMLSGIKKEKHEMTLKRCPDCMRPVLACLKKCPHCDYEWETMDRAPVALPEEKEGTLVKISERPELSTELTIQIARGAHNLKEAIKIAKQNGIAHTSAFYIWTRILKNDPKSVVRL